jgi:glucose/arabinose dehydrogenase
VKFPRFSVVFIAVALAAASCGDDESVVQSSRTTVPVVTQSPTTSTDLDVTTPEAPDTTTTTGEPDPRALNVDLTQAAVAATPVGRYQEPIDTAVAANGELWLAERRGTVSVLDPVTGALGEVVVDISGETVAGGERGLLGIAADGANLYINFTDLDGTTNVDAFVLDGDGRPGERHHLLSIEQPFGNHNGGGLAIGPDGHLYIGVGDGGSGGDPLGAGQDPTQILGSLLRIDPTPGAASPYEIPIDNPYADGEEGRPEIFAIGLRNPWRFSFDPITDDLWIADVGQNAWEEVDLLLGTNGFGLGANLGWNLREGTHEFSGDRPENNVDPVFEYPHGDGSPSGCSISGGVVYRGLAIPELIGSYVFGDYCKSSIWAISVVDDRVVFRDLELPISDLVGVTADADGELLALSLGGSVTRIVAG